MQPDDGRKKSPYHGIVLSCFLLIIVPIAMYFFMVLVFKKFDKNPHEELNTYTCIVLGVGVGFLFQLSCIFGGLFRGTFSVVVKRVVNFFDNLTISFRFAWKMYVDELKEDGVVFWIILIIILATLAVVIYGLIMFNNAYKLI